MLRESSRAQVASVIHHPIPLIICHFIWLTTFQATIERVHVQPDCAQLKRTKASFVRSHKDRSPNLRTVSRTHVLIWIANLNDSIWTLLFPFHSMCAHHSTLGRPVDQGCVHNHCKKVFDAVVRHASTILISMLTTVFPKKKKPYRDVERRQLRGRLRKWALGRTAGRQMLRLEKHNFRPNWALHRSYK